MNTEERLAAAADPGVVALVIARTMQRARAEGFTRAAEQILGSDIAHHGITATQDQARALLDAVREHDGYAGDAEDWPAMCEALDRLEAALTAVVGAA